jgi:hypothetical protein
MCDGNQGAFDEGNGSRRDGWRALRAGLIVLLIARDLIFSFLVCNLGGGKGL